MKMSKKEYEVINFCFYFCIYALANFKYTTNAIFEFTGAYTVPLDLMILPGILYYYKYKEVHFNEIQQFHQNYQN